MNHLSFIISIVLCLGLTKCKGQDGQNTAPSSNYNVHREYDQNGNLIHYDSTVVSTWKYGSNTNQDSLLQEWGNNSENPFSLNDSIKSEDSSYYGFNFPDQELNFQAFPDINEMMKNMHPSNKDIAKQMKEMEKRMDEMMQRNMELFKQFDEGHFYLKVPSHEGTDSIARPELPKQMKNSENTNIINI
jgi:hypothetical protein